MRVLIGVLALLLFAACSSSDSSDSPDSSGGGDRKSDHTSVADPTLNRSSADQALFDLAEAALDGGAPENGVALEDSCPVLGERSVSDVVAESGVALELEGSRATGFLNAVGDGFNVNCAAQVDGRHASLSLSQTPARNAAELLRLTPSDDEISFDTDVDAAGFAEGSLLVAVRSDRELVTWVGDGFALQAGLHDDGPLARDDQLAFLAAALGVVTETLTSDPDSPDSEAAETPAPVVDRESVIGVFNDVIEDHGSQQVIIDPEEGCPFLDDNALAEVVDAAGWAIDPAFDGGVALGGQRTLLCNIGDAPRARSISAAFGRPMTVAQLAAETKGPLRASSPSMMITALETSRPELEGRAYVRELEVDETGPTPTAVGWIDNGLRIEASIREGDDPEQILAAVLPATLAGIGVS